MNLTEIDPKKLKGVETFFVATIIKKDLMYNENTKKHYTKLVVSDEKNRLNSLFCIFCYDVNEFDLSLLQVGTTHLFKCYLNIRNGMFLRFERYRVLKKDF